MFKQLLHKTKFVANNARTTLAPFKYSNQVRLFSGSASETEEIERDTLEYDGLVVGGGPAGLSAAIKLKQLCIKNDTDIEVCVIEKGSHVGAHILSGNVFETRALDELFENWKELGVSQTNHFIKFLLFQAPLECEVKDDRFMWFPNEKSKIEVP